MHRVGTNDPHGFQLACPQGIKHGHRRQAGLGGQVRHAPQRRHFRSVRRVLPVAVSGQQIRHRPHFPSAHGIRLPGQRQRGCARLADFPGGQVQVNQRGIVVRTALRLVQPLAIQRQAGATGKPVRRLHDVGLGQATLRGGIGQRRGIYLLVQCRKTIGVFSDKILVQQSIPQHHLQQRVEQHDVRSGSHRQMQIGATGRIGTARIDHNQLLLRIALPGLLDAAEQHRMSMRGIRADNQNAACLLDIGITARRCIRTQRGLVACHRRGHAQARVGIDVVAAD